jgi:hypothetical protein
VVPLSTGSEHVTFTYRAYLRIKCVVVVVVVVVVVIIIIIIIIILLKMI